MMATGGFLTCTIRDEDGQAVGVIVLATKTFSSGKVGFFGQGKIVIDGQRFQAQGQLVKIGEQGEPIREQSERV